MRQFIRHPSSIPIQLHELKGQTKPGTTTLNNVSFGGVSCLCNELVEVGTTISITIKCIDPDFEMTGRAVWCHPKDDMYEIGVEFIASKDKMFLLRMVEQVCHIEHYKNEVRQNEDRHISSEQAAQEWIEKYAASFPAH